MASANVGHWHGTALAGVVQAVARGPVDVSATVEPDPAESADARVVRVEDGVVEWRCLECSGWQPLTDDECEACGTPRRAFARAVGRFPTPDGLPRRPGWPRRLLAIVVALVVPGGGYVVAGRVAPGLLRVLVVALWAGAAVHALGRVGWDLTRPTVVTWSQVPLVVVVLGVGITFTWLSSVVDTMTMTGVRRSEVIGSRAFVWVVFVVTLALVGATLVDVGIVDPPLGWT